MLFGSEITAVERVASFADEVSIGPWEASFGDKFDNVENTEKSDIVALKNKIVQYEK